jgi:hypothetical protein
LGDEESVYATLIRKPEQPCHQGIDFVVDFPTAVAIRSIVEWGSVIDEIECEFVDPRVMDHLLVVSLVVFQE